MPKYQKLVVHGVALEYHCDEVETEEDKWGWEHAYEDGNEGEGMRWEEQMVIYNYHSAHVNDYANQPNIRGSSFGFSNGLNTIRQPVKSYEYQ